MTYFTIHGHDAYLDPPDDNCGNCPTCGCPQEDAEHDQANDLWVCPECGDRYKDEDAREDPVYAREEAALARAGL